MKTLTRLEAPDGGWGILVCIGMAISFIGGIAAIPSFGLVFGDFFKEIGAETSAVAVITSAFFCALSFAGLLSGSLFKRFSVRTVGLLGAILYFVGSLLQIFVQSTAHLLVAFSLLQGAGFGLIIPTAYTTFNNYFIKRRMTMMGFAQSLLGVGTMLYPIVIQKLLEWYGFRGCLTILAAINSHVVLGMLLMQSVEWHLREVSIMEHEMSECETATIPLSNVVDEIKTVNLSDSNHLRPLIDHDSHRRRSSALSKDELKKLSSRASSITSLGNWSGAVVVSDASPEMTHAVEVSHENISQKTIKHIKWQTIVDYLDLTLLQDAIYVNIVLGISFALYSDLAFFTLQPIYLFELNFNKADTASVIAIGAAADLISRIFLACSAVFLQTPSRYIYLAGSFFTIIARFAFLYVSDFTNMAIITAIMGFFRTWLHVPLPLVFAEYLSKDRFASGYGLFMFLQGNIMFIIGPIVGFLRDKTQNYILAFHVLNFFMAACAVPWIIEISLFKLCKSKKISQFQ